MGKVKLFAIGVLTGTIALSSANYYKGKFIEKSNKVISFEDEYGIPDLSYSTNPNDKIVEKKYSFDYLGKQMEIQDKDLKVWGFDSNGKPYKLDLEEIEVEDILKNVLSPNYLTELEYKVYKVIQNKDNIINEYNVYLLFNNINSLYEQYLTRENFDGLEQRKDYLYNLCISYIHPESKYTFAKKKFSELNKTIQKDIEKEIVDIKYMKDNNIPKEEGFIDELTDSVNKKLNYGVFKKGK